MKNSLLKFLAVFIGVIAIGYIFFGRFPTKEDNQRVANVTEISEEVTEASPLDEEFEFNNKCLQAAAQINDLVHPPKEVDPLLPKTVEEQIRWLESDMDDGRVIETTLSERLGHPETQVFIAYDPTSSDEYQVVEIRCSEWPVGGTVLYVVNRTQNKVLTVEANEYIQIETISDIDGDGTVELVFQDVGGGNCWACSRKRILHISGQRYEEVEMPTNYTIDDIIHRPPGILNGFVVKASDISWENALNLPHCCGPVPHRYFQIYGTQVTDVSSKFNDKYQELHSLNDGENHSITGSITNLLLREAMGERDEGWQQFIQDWKQVDVSEISGVDDYAIRVLAEFIRQYQEQELFTPFDIGENGNVRSRL